MYTEQMSQGLSFMGNMVPPQSGAPGTFDTGAIDMQKARRATFFALVGTLGASATLDAKLQVSIDNSTFTDLATVNASATGVAITQITVNNKIATLEIRTDQMPAGYRYVRMRSTIGVAASQYAAVALGGEGNEKPLAVANDVLAVTQRVVVALP